MGTAVVGDVRHEMEQYSVSSTTKKHNVSVKPLNVKMSFRIRTLPRECNPTPVPTNRLNTSSSTVLSRVASESGSLQEMELESFQLDNPFDDITENTLKQSTGSQDLAQVKSLQISLDSTKQSVEAIGELLPALQQLHLHRSNLRTFRDLGTSLVSLCILWAEECQIFDLDGINALRNLQELYIQHNHVSDISPLIMHEELRVVNLEDNQLADIDQVEQLAFCPQLISLYLKGNAVETVENYRQIIANFVPQLMSLDGQTLFDSERAKLCDADIESAIQKHRETLQAGTASSLHTMGSDELIGPHQLLYSSSTASLNGLTIDSPRYDDAGSRLTHGTDIVFAGNVSSALRRHRYEAETKLKLSRHSSYDGILEGPTDTQDSPNHRFFHHAKTPASRISITNTLDRARELYLHKVNSCDSIIDKRNTWQLDSDGISQIGVSRNANQVLYTGNRSLTFKRLQRKGSNNDVVGHKGARARGEDQPNTTAKRNGTNSRKTSVVDTARNDPSRLNSRRNSSKQIRPSSGSPGVNLLIPDDYDASKRHCSPTKTLKGVLTTAFSRNIALGHSHDLNLEVLSPKVNLSTAKRHLPTSLTRKQQLERSLGFHGDDEVGGSSSDSDADDESCAYPATTTEFSSTSVPETAFFDVALSLNAIDKWRDELECDGITIMSVNSLYQTCFAPQSNYGHVKGSSKVDIHDKKNGSDSVGNQHNSQQQEHDPIKTLGPRNYESDSQIVQPLKKKSSRLKTREGFRSHFEGIEKEGW